MKILCQRSSQLRINDKVITVEKGDVLELETNEVPRNFISLETKEKPHKVDFGTAGEKELLAAKWTLDEAKTAVKAFYGVNLIYNEGDTKKDVVDRILDARFRSTDITRTVPPMVPQG